MSPEARQHLQAEAKAFKFERPSKYHNKKIVTPDGTFDSRREANRWGELCLLVRAGEIVNLRRQVEYVLNVNGQHVCKYIADAVYETAGGEKIVEDTKGFRTQVYRIKKKLMLAIHGIKIMEV